MDTKAFNRSQEEASIAAEKLAAMKSADDITKLSQLWSEFLTHIQRAFTKMHRASQHSEAKDWYKTIENIRQNDDLLNYIRVARNADEHGIEDITRKQPGSVGFRPKVENEAVIVDYMELSPSKITLGPLAAKNFEIVFQPAAVHLVPVKERQKTLAPPRTHVGKPIDDPTPINIGELALRFVNDMISKARSFEPKSPTQ